jgi:hypothetical protein
MNQRYKVAILRHLTNILRFIIHWSPRVLCIILAAFPMLFTFKQEATFLKKLADILFHLIPSFLVIFLLILSWKWPWIGGIILIGLGTVFFIWYAQKNQSYALGIYLFINGILFLLDWFQKKDIRKIT